MKMSSGIVGAWLTDVRYCGGVANGCAVLGGGGGRG